MFLQTIEHVQDPVAVLEHFRALLAPGGVAYVSTPNLLTLAAARGGEVRQPVARQGVPGGGVPRRCASGVFGHVELLGLFHARKLRVHELALRLGWDAVHARLGITKRVLRPLHAGDRDQRLRARPATDSTARWISSPSAGCNGAPDVQDHSTVRLT